ncbi:MAG: MalY/PatB family protein [Alkalispirochaetaceae bacterium]
MSFSFDDLHERRESRSLKWDLAHRDELPLWVADMDFAVAPAIQRRLAERVEHPIYGYPLLDDSFFDPFISWFSRRHRWEIEREELLYVPGVMPAVHRAIEIHTDPGDEVVIQSPVYFPFFKAIQTHDRVVATAPLREVERGNKLYFEMDFGALEDVFARGASLFVLCSPHNPVGRVWRREELEEVARLAERYDVVVLSDEIHADIIFPGYRFVPYMSLGESVSRRSWATLAPSKTFNIPGLLTAYAVVPHKIVRERVRDAFERIGAHMPNLFSMEATIAAYEEGEQWLDELIPYLRENYELLCSYLEEKLETVRAVEQEGTYITWLDFRTILSRSGLGPKQFAAAMRKEGRVWLSPGHVFGGEGNGFMRINIATPRKRLEEGLDRIERFTRRWR